MVVFAVAAPTWVQQLRDGVPAAVSEPNGSAPWRHYRHYLLATDPIDVWREGCWRYVVFPGTADGRRVEVVFAVYLEPRRPAVRVGIADPAAGARSRDDSAAALPLPVSN